MSYFVHANEWRSIAIIPEEDPIFFEPITLIDLIQAFGGLLIFTEDLFTGYTTDPERVPGGFALYDEDFGAVYGVTQYGIVNALYFDNTFCDCGIPFDDVMGTMERFAAEHRLVMNDKLLDTVVALGQPGAMNRYFEEL